MARLTVSRKRLSVFKLTAYTDRLYGHVTANLVKGNFAEVLDLLNIISVELSLLGQECTVMKTNIKAPIYIWTFYKVALKSFWNVSVVECTLSFFSPRRDPKLLIYTTKKPR